jgi:hypothetical protein
LSSFLSASHTVPSLPVGMLLWLVYDEMAVPLMYIGEAADSP